MNLAAQCSLVCQLPAPCLFHGCMFELIRADVSKPDSQTEWVLPHDCIQGHLLRNLLLNAVRPTPPVMDSFGLFLPGTVFLDSLTVTTNAVISYLGEVSWAWPSVPVGHLRTHSPLRSWSWYSWNLSSDFVLAPGLPGCQFCRVSKSLLMH